MILRRMSLVSSPYILADIRSFKSSLEAISAVEHMFDCLRQQLGDAQRSVVNPYANYSQVIQELERACVSPGVVPGLVGALLQIANMTDALLP